MNQHHHAAEERQDETSAEQPAATETKVCIACGRVIVANEPPPCVHCP